MICKGNLCCAIVEIYSCIQDVARDCNGADNFCKMDVEWTLGNLKLTGFECCCKSHDNCAFEMNPAMNPDPGHPQPTDCGMFRCMPSPLPSVAAATTKIIECKQSWPASILAGFTHERTCENKYCHKFVGHRTDSQEEMTVYSCMYSVQGDCHNADNYCKKDVTWGLQTFSMVGYECCCNTGDYCANSMTPEKNKPPQ